MDPVVNCDGSDSALELVLDEEEEEEQQPQQQIQQQEQHEAEVGRSASPSLWPSSNMKGANVDPRARVTPSMNSHPDV